jgi:hypothetical protein
MAVEFYCPSCGSGLSVRRAYFAILYCVALILLFIAAQALGFRGTPHLALVLICVYPTYWVVVWVTIRFFAVDLVETGDFHGVLYDRADAGVSSGFEDDAARPGSEDGTNDGGSNAVPRFQSFEPARSFDGTLLSVGGVAVAAYLVWSLGTALIYRLNPDSAETRYAPRGFALRAELRRDTVAFTNESSRGWVCEVSIGPTVGSGLRTSFPLGAQETRRIPYGDFRASLTGLQPDMLRSLARQGLWARCRDASSRSHFAALK